MSKVTVQELLDAGVHFGHLKKKWNPNMAPYIFMDKNNIHIIDLNKTLAKLDESAQALKQIARSGKKILFVATKKQAKEIVANKVKNINMPFVTERWPGGMLTNFATIRKSIRKMAQIDRMATDGTFENMSKRERLMVSRQRAKLERDLGSISDLTRLPSAIFIIDVKKEHIAVREAKKLNIPTFGMVDTNSDPNDVDFVIPANDDASRSIEIILDVVTKAISEGLSERKVDKEKTDKAAQEQPVKVEPKAPKAAGKPDAPRPRIDEAKKSEGATKVPTEKGAEAPKEAKKAKPAVAKAAPAKPAAKPAAKKTDSKK